ncbi:uncharacterized protein LOC109717981 [Ananas comosus]|uniref:Uncharacterized protein LOC109717981 n=1 Tax=Ananas comosus TaxID=4615 RepID=A0A6P5FV55_ANACO|nr:uncharacterized protein LOC109717981 [Ananas comosus]
MALVPPVPQQTFRASSSYSRAEGVAVPQQSEQRQQASSGSVYEAQIEDSTTADRVVAEIGPLLHAREVQISDHILQLQDLDVVLGRDWLAWCYATINCEARTVVFREPGQEEFMYRSCRSILFATWSEPSMHRFLVMVVVVPTAASGLEDISVVCEFPDVFPPKLTL